MKAPCLIVGDLNCPDIDWQTFTAPIDNIQDKLLDFIAHNGYVQMVCECTRGNNVLDVVLTNEPLTVCNVDVAPPIGTSDHCQVDFVVALAAVTSATEPGTLDSVQQQQVYNWREADYISMSCYLNNINWPQLFTTNLTADSLWTAFADILNAAITKCVPLKQVSVRSGSTRVKKAYTKRIKRALARKRCLWRNAKADHDNVEARELYRKAESRCRLLIRNYEIKKENDIIRSNNLGTFYRFINNRLTNRQGIGVLTDACGAPVNSNEGRAELLNNYFCSVCTQDDGTMPYFKCSNPSAMDSCIDHIVFNSANIGRAIAKLKPNLASGIDNFPPLLVKKISPCLLEPLALLYSSFLSVGKIPDEWRRAVVTPIYKSGPAGDVSNYRPIALTCVFSKIMECVVANDISGYLLHKGLISKQQHGFLAKRSTATNLTEALNDWTIALNNRQSVTVAYIDYKKAFDSVCHNKLFTKLSAYGITGSLLSWIKDFLNNRSQVVQVGSARSSEKYLVSGIVQGSCLGPLLFLIYINDVTDVMPLGCVCKLFADDLKLYSVASIVDDNALVIQDSLDKLCNWSVKWQLSVSYKKCAILSIGRNAEETNRCFKLGNEVVQPLSTVTDLGVQISHDLSFALHINKIVAKAHARANLIHKCFISKDAATLIKAFTVYVRPIVEYASVVWSPYHINEINKLESVQRRFTKRIVGLSSKSYAERMSMLQLDSLEVRRLRFDLLYTYKILFGLVDIDWSKMFSLNRFAVTRGHCYKLYARTSRINVRHNFFCNRVVNAWNRLPEEGDNNYFKSYNSFRSFLMSFDLTGLL